MRAVLVQFRVGLRQRWRSWLLLAVLVALAGGAVISLAAGARRTQSAYSRFVSTEHAADVILFISGTGRQRPAPFEHLPEVARSAVAIGLPTTAIDFTPVVLTDRRLGSEVNRFKLLSGRLPRKANETMVGFLFATSRHLHVGSLLTVRAPRPASQGSPGAGPGAPGNAPASTTRPIRLKVVGIEAAPGEFPPLSYSNQKVIYLSSAILRSPLGTSWEHASGSVVALYVRLHRGAHQITKFYADAEQIAGAPVGTATLSDQGAQVQASMHLQAVALWLMAGFAALTAVLVLTQLLVREISEDASDYPTLRALGMTSHELALTALLRMSAAVTAGAIGAIAVGFGLSPIFPLGTAGIAEPNPGPTFDALALLVGAAGLLVVLVGLVAVAALRASRPSWAMRGGEAEGESGGWMHNVLRLGALPVVVTMGVRMALRPGRGRSAVPVRSTIVATVVAVGAMTTALTFGASLGHLLATPHLYGTTYDADVELNANFGDIRSVVPALRSDRSISAFAVSESGIPMRSGRTSFGALYTKSVVGHVEPVVVEGMLPHAANEIALGARTMSDLHTGIGGTIPVTVEGLTRPLRMHVVGRVVLSPVSDTQGLGRGAVVTLSAMDAFVSAIRSGLQASFQVPPPGDAFVRFQPGLSRAAAISELEQRLGGVTKVLVTAPTEPTDVVNFGQVRDLPEILAALLGAVATLTMAYLLVTAIRRRRRDLAVLKTLGFAPRQVSSTIAWQATTVAALAVIVGVPLGLVAGRWVWAAVGNNVGVVVEPAMPWIWVAALVPVALLIANLVAAGPAVAAGRIAPGRVLRSE